jgi:hypothetical protein
MNGIASCAPQERVTHIECRNIFDNTRSHDDSCG